MPARLGKLGLDEPLLQRMYKSLLADVTLSHPEPRFEEIPGPGVSFLSPFAEMSIDVSLVGFKFYHYWTYSL